MIRPFRSILNKSLLTTRTPLYKSSVALVNVSRAYATPTDDVVRMVNQKFDPVSSSASTNIRGSPSANHVETNVKSETNRLEKTMERFWEKVTTEVQAEDPHKGSFTICLDNKSIKTPNGHPLVIPASKPVLANLIAHEWTVLPSLKIKPHLVPLTSLASRAIDLTHGNSLSPQAEIDTEALGNIIEALMPYLDTDTLLVFSPASDCEGKLRPAQENEYRPVIAYAEEFWAPFSDDKKSFKLNWLDSDVSGFAGNRQSAEAKKAVSNWIKSLDPWKLVALERATMSAKSLIIGMMLITNQMTVKEAVRAATLESVFQTELWGEVEDSHDVDFHDLKRTLGSAYILAIDNK